MCRKGTSFGRKVHIGDDSRVRLSSDIVGGLWSCIHDAALAGDAKKACGFLFVLEPKRYGWYGKRRGWEINLEWDGWTEGWSGMVVFFCFP